MSTILSRWIIYRLKEGGREGSILGMALIVVVLISLMGLALMDLGKMNWIEVSRSNNSSKAFWAAESGLFHARARLRSDANFRESYFPVVFTNELGASVWVSSSDHVNFGIVSTGAVKGVIRVVQTMIHVDESWPSAFNYSLFSSNSMKLAKGTSVTGDGTNGDVYASGGFAGGYKFPATNNCDVYDGTSTNLPSPVPVMPQLNTSEYDGLLATAAGSMNTTYPTSLSGTNFVNTGIIISNSVSGPGVLVVAGTVSIGAGAVIGNGITIIAQGALDITSTPIIGSNEVFYSATSIKIAKENNFSAGYSALITPGSIDIQKTFQFKGLIFAGGNIVMDKATGTSATITGCVVAGGSLTLKKEFVVTYDASQLPLDPESLGFEPEVYVTDGQWEEVFQ